VISAKGLLTIHRDRCRGLGNAVPSGKCGHPVCVRSDPAWDHTNGRPRQHRHRV